MKRAVKRSPPELRSVPIPTGITKFLVVQGYACHCEQCLLDQKHGVTGDGWQYCDGCAHRTMSLPGGSCQKCGSSAHAEKKPSLSSRSFLQIAFDLEAAVYLVKDQFSAIKLLDQQRADAVFRFEQLSWEVDKLRAELTVAAARAHEGGAR
jgi:hypothetical protein